MTVSDVDLQQEEEDLIEVREDEVEAALKSMKNGKSPGPDNITAEVLKCGGETIIKIIAQLFTKCLRTNTVPSSWKNANIIILHKKGDTKDLTNYRPISLLSHTYKLFTKIITKRLNIKLDENQPAEQAGFRSNFSTIDHLQTVNQVIEKSREYQLPLCLAFVDYEKAFDSIETNAVIQALKNQGIETTYIKIIKEIYTNATATLQLHQDSKPIIIRRGVRRGDTISPKVSCGHL